MRRTSAQDTRDHDHQDDHRKHHEREGERVPEHDDENRDHCREHGDEVWHGNANELAEGVHVVGVVRHDVAVLVRVKVANGQVLHVVEHLVADLHEGALADYSRELGLSDVRAQGNHIAANETQDDARDLDLCCCPVSRAHEILHHGDGLLHEDGRQRREDRGGENAEHLCGYVNWVVVEGERQRAPERLPGVCSPMAAAGAISVL